jgi:MerR family mercuric resistance operon transcriptional regulator
VEKKMKKLRIGELAKNAKVNIETIRYYERRGLIPKPPRSESGYRQYPEETVERIKFIKSAQKLGFSLAEILELLTLRLDPNTTCGEIKRRAEAKILQIEEKIKALQRMKKALMKLIEICDGEGPISECPILDALDTGEENLA